MVDLHCPFIIVGQLHWTCVLVVVFFCDPKQDEESRMVVHDSNGFLSTMVQVPNVVKNSMR